MVAIRKPEDHLALGIARIAVPVIKRYSDIGPGERMCGACGHIDAEGAFCRGKGRQYGQHPDHVYCPGCGADLDWIDQPSPTFEQARTFLRHLNAELSTAFQHSATRR